MVRRFGYPLIGISVSILVGASSLLLATGAIPECLGPLGVTAVRCGAHGGRPPTDPLGPPLLAAVCALGALIVLPVRRAAIDGVAAVVGLIAGPLAYALVRGTTLEGPDYDGAWLVIPLPFDPWAIGLWAAAGCLLALVITGCVRWAVRPEGA